ncbi:MAG: hypothetical protein K2I42_05195 [Anaeroplasmataceae bacterium]|nr:hypothetical protein [Anaeroplasmataceae bacterium]
MSIEWKKNLAHLGSILFNYSVLGIIIILGITFSQVFLIIYYVVLIVISLLTLGVVLLSEEFRSLWSLGQNVNSILMQVERWMPIVAGICGVILVFSFVLLCFDSKERKTKNKLIISIFMMVIFIVILILFGGKTHV